MSEDMMDDYLPESDVAKAVLTDLPAEVAVARAALRYAVQHSMFCSRTGAVLDIKTAVYWSVTLANGQTAGECVSQEWWAQFGPKLRAGLAAAPGIELTEVLEGATLFTGRSR